MVLIYKINLKIIHFNYSIKLININQIQKKFHIVNSTKDSIYF